MIDRDTPQGAYEDQTHSGRRLKPLGKRKKPYVIECRYVNCRLFEKFQLWHIYHRYETAARRDTAFAALVKKEGDMRFPFFHVEYRIKK